jgi:DsbC/DsbD-like thiol-disulfide interchange protein
VQNRLIRWNNTPFLTTLALVSAAIVPVAAGAQLGQEAESPVVTLKEMKVNPVSVAPGGKATVSLTLALKPGFHINANKPDSDMQIPTELEFVAPAKATGIVLGKPVFPTPKAMKFSYSDKPLKVYEQTLTVTVPVAAGKTAPGGKVPFKGTLRYQACNETACFPPASLDFNGAVTVAGKAAKK